MASWTDEDIKDLLDTAERVRVHTAGVNAEGLQSLLAASSNLGIAVNLIRKERAVGIVPQDPNTRIAYELWEDVALEVQVRPPGCPGC